MPDITEIVKRIKEFRKELADMRQLLSKSGHYDWDGPDEGLLNEKLKRWTSRVYEALKAWGFTTEAEEVLASTLVSICTMGSTPEPRFRTKDCVLYRTISPGILNIT